MKSTSKILPAIAMLVVSAVMLTTASFAWFALNNSVSADGMSVNVKSDSIYLLISAAKTEVENTPEISVLETGNEDYTKAGLSTSGIALDNNTAGVFPAAYGTTDALSAGGKIVTKGEDLKSTDYWYTAIGQDAASSAIKADSIDSLTEKGGFEEYVVRYRYYVALAAGSNDMDYLKVSNLAISMVGTGGNVSPVRAVVACGDVYEVFDSSKNAGTLDLMGAAADSKMEAGTVYEVFVYVYYDGNDSAVTTNGLPDLRGANITFSLAVGTDPANP